MLLYYNSSAYATTALEMRKMQIYSTFPETDHRWKGLRPKLQINFKSVWALFVAVIKGCYVFCF